MSGRPGGAGQGAARRPVLVVQHEDDCPPAWFAEWMVQAGATLDVRRAHRGQPLPATPADHAGLLVLGGTPGAYADRDHPWLAPTRDLLREACGLPLPTLGICLGHQLLAVATGGRVEPRAAGRHRGLDRVGWTAAARDDPLLGPLASGGPDRRAAVHYNSDVVTELPPGATPLAYAPDGTVQALRVGASAWGVQWHPEAGADVVAAWVGPLGVDSTDRALLATVRGEEELLRTTWRPLAAGFAAACTAAARAPGLR